MPWIPIVRSLVALTVAGFVATGSAHASVQARGSDPPDVDDLRTALRDHHPDKRRSAVKKLSTLGGEDAMELVVSALADPSGKVADEAQLVVVEFESLGVGDLLLGSDGLRSRDEVVRLRAAEAIGRLSGPVPAERIARSFDRRDPATLRTALWSVERLARREALSGDVFELVERAEGLLKRRADDRVRAAALHALAALSRSSARRALDRVREIRDRETRCSYLMVATDLGDPGLEGILEAAAFDEDPAVRMKALELMRLQGFRSTPSVLLERLRVEPRPAVRGKIVDALRWMTGMRHGDKLVAWEHTVDHLPHDWDPSQTKNAYSEARRRSGTVAELSRLEPESDRVAILVDFSGSLWNERADGTRRKDLLDPEVIALLERLVQTGTFFLVPYTGEPHPFTDRPIDATQRNVRLAQKFFSNASMQGSGNLFDALQLALSFDAIDRVMVLTDGAPTGGMRWDVDLMVDLVREQIRFRPVVLDFVLLDAPRGLEKRWQSLAESTGGRTVALSFQK
ncbi:MAG: hypothetical protein AAF726_22805 [Planctomycetota bacterium]